MSMINQGPCSNCGKTLQRFAVSIIKCKEHDFKICTGCAVKFRGKDCPHCVIQRSRLESQSRIENKENVNRAQELQKVGGVQQMKNQARELQLQQQLSESILKLGQAQQLLNQYKAKLNQAQQKQQQLKNKQAQSRQRYQQLRKEADQSQARLKQISQDLQDAKTANSNFQKEIKALNEDLTITQTKNSQLLLQQLKQKDRFQKQQQQQNESHKKQTQQLKNRYEKDLKQIKILKQDERNIEVERLKKQIDKLRFDALTNKSANLAMISQKLKQHKDELGHNEEIHQAKKQYTDMLQKYHEENRKLNQFHEQQKRKLIQKHQNELRQLNIKNELQKQQSRSKFQNEKLQIIQRYEQQSEKFKNHTINERNMMIQQNQKEKQYLLDTLKQKQNLYSAKMQQNQSNCNRKIQSKYSQLKTRQQQFRVKQLQLNMIKSNLNNTIVDLQEKLKIEQDEKNRLKQILIVQNANFLQTDQERKEIRSYINTSVQYITHHFRTLDKSYEDGSIEKLKHMSILIKQYNTLIAKIKNPELIRMVQDKQIQLKHQIRKQTSQIQYNMKDIQLNDFYFIQSENGKKLKMLIQKIGLFKKINFINQQGIDLEIYDIKIRQRLKQIFNNFNKYLSKYNEQENDLQLITYTNQYYKFKNYIMKNFQQFYTDCKQQFQSVEHQISIFFDRMIKIKQNISRIDQMQKIESFLLKNQEIKRYLQIINAGKHNSEFKNYAQKHLKNKFQMEKQAVIEIIAKYKLILKQKLDEVAKKKDYYKCFSYQKHYKKFKVFDQLLTKDQNHFHGIYFNELYNKSILSLKAIKQQKMQKIDSMITDKHINIGQVKKQYPLIHFDQSIKSKYHYKLKITLLNRINAIEKINAFTNISPQQLQDYKDHYQQLLELKQIKGINSLSQINDLQHCMDGKLDFYLKHIQDKYRQYYINSVQYKNIQETGNNIKILIPFELFTRKNFKQKHEQFVSKILSKDYPKLQEILKSDGQRNSIVQSSMRQSLRVNTNLIQQQLGTLQNKDLLTGFLFKLNKNNVKAMKKLIADPRIKVNDEHFQYFHNLQSHLSRQQFKKINEKMNQYIKQQIDRMQKTQWSLGDHNSEAQDKLLSKIKNFHNKEMIYYRQMIKNRKTKCLQETQKFVNAQKRKLKEQNFQTLLKFVNDCSQNQKADTKPTKTYITILEQYMNYNYQSSFQNFNKKQIFLQNIYKIYNPNHSKTVRQILKSNQYKIYFCLTNIDTIMKHIDNIERYKGEDYQNIIVISNEKIINTFKIYKIFQKYQNNSLMEENDKNHINDKLDQAYQTIMRNIDANIKTIKPQNILDHDFNRKSFFVHLIKIQIYLRLNKELNKLNLKDKHTNFQSQHDRIIRKINSKILKIMQESKQFNFYKDELRLQYSNDKFLIDHLKKIQNSIQLFKQLKNIHDKNIEYIRNGYLQGIKWHQIDQNEIINIVNMSWRRQYSQVKKQIKELMSNSQMIIVLKYKMILKEKEIVKNQDMLCLKEIIKEQYDFKRIVQDQLFDIYNKIENVIHTYEKDYELFNINLRQMQDKKIYLVQRQKTRIKQKLEKLTHQVNNSFHEITDQQERQIQISRQLNSLTNQAKAQEEELVNSQNQKVQLFRKRFTNKRITMIAKIIETLMMIKKIQANFDQQIQMISKMYFEKIENQMGKFDKQTKNQMINYLKRSKNSEMVMRLSQLKIFKHINEQQFQDSTKAMNNIHQIIKKCPEINQNSKLVQKLVASYEIYAAELNRIESQFVEYKSENKVIELIKETKLKANQLDPAVIVARIFSVYAIYKCINSKEEQISYSSNPHIAQVVAILLLIDSANRQYAQLANRLIQVKTGEGKSRVLGGLNCYLALKGYEVYCGCYSSYLSQRDEEEFHNLFVSYGVQNIITYGPFSQHCQSILNEGNKFSYKQITKKVLLNEKLTSAQEKYLQKLKNLITNKNNSKRILVIDEVDVFFDENYFGQIYMPGIVLDGPEVKNMIKFIWQNHQDKKLRSIVNKSKCYSDLMQSYPHLSEFLAGQVQTMMCACSSYNAHPYEIRNNMIQYIDNDTVNEKLNFGYSTAFASCYQYERGKISQENYNKNANISLIIGQFSYAELPIYFDYILGVSGTVKVMSEFRKKIMKDYYKITDIYGLPSIYGDSLRQIVGQTITQEGQFIKTLLHRVTQVRKEERPILIFFQSEEQINKVSSSHEFSELTQYIYKITEKMPPQMRNPLINYAGSKNRITLISAAFSRGTDFKVYDSQINQKGGMHVIQTFISKNQSDYIQILGRTGRQGKKGTFEIITRQSYLIKNKINVDFKDFNNSIRQYWQQNDRIHGEQLENSIYEAKKLHQQTFEMISDMVNQNTSLIKQVIRLNKPVAEIAGRTVRTVIAIDGTNSMGAGLNAVLKILNQTISKTQEIIDTQSPNSSFNHKIMIYRNYNSPTDKLLQQSEYSKDSAYLQSFLSGIKAEGGLGNEALQIMFYEIGQLPLQEKADQIILIGDAPANLYTQILKHRKRFKDSAKHSGQLYPLLQSVEKYSQKINELKIPIHSFYILRKKFDEQNMAWDEKVERYFKNLSESTEGQCQELDIKQKEKSFEQLTSFISKRVLQLIGGRELAQYYDTKFKKIYL